MSKTTIIYDLASQLGQVLLKRKLRCAVAESCTGGALAAAITDVAGSSQWFDRGFVTYTNEAKEEVLAVPKCVISSQGAVSEATVRAMAHGTIAVSDAQVSVAISGIAGPGGGSPDKPVGTVWIAWAGNLLPTYAQCYLFKGDRIAIRQQAVQVALEGLIKRCDIERPHSGLARYFFALWPDDPLAKQLHRRGCEPFPVSHGKVVNEKNLHMTLLYLGCVPPDVLQSARQIASELHTPPFKLHITHASYWPQAHLRLLTVENVPVELEQLVSRLNHRLITVGFKPEKRPFIPHITIARKCKQVYLAEEIEPLLWTAHDFCLVKSTGSEGISNYEIIERWSLRQ
jgi:nicotinamide-nucleotide amidase